MNQEYLRSMSETPEQEENSRPKKSPNQEAYEMKILCEHSHFPEDIASVNFELALFSLETKTFFCTTLIPNQHPLMWANRGR